MKFLYVGDIMGKIGIEVVADLLPKLRQDRQIDIVVAQAENVSGGKGITKTDFERLKILGIDFFTGGNHTFDNDEIFSALSDPSQPIIRPANYPRNMPGLGWKYLACPQGKVLFASLLGQTVGKGASLMIDNPLQSIDQILAQAQTEEVVATLVNFHGDFSSEKVVIGDYLDGRVTAVIGDHWHIPTADARVLPGGTAHITDVGMCGVLNSSLGIKYQIIIDRWRDQKRNRNELELEGPRQFNAVEIESDPSTHLATSIEQLRIV